MAWFINLLIGLALQIIGYLLMPKPKKPKPPEAQDMESPTVDAGPVPVLFGTINIKGWKFLWWGDKAKVEKNKDEGSKKK